jgi:hypothetical protein
MASWWLSFADPDKPKGSQFLGLVIIEADDPEGAIQEAHRKRINPGGEVAMTRVPDDFALDMRDRLLTKAEAEEIGEIDN